MSSWQDQIEQELMKKALNQAKKAFNKNEVPIGAIVVDKNNKIIGKGYNQVESKMCQSEHAEIIAIKNACKKIGDWRLEDCTLYVTLEPCSMCISLIILSRISRCIYATKSNIFGFSVDKHINFELYRSPILIKEGACKVEAQNLLGTFFKNQRKIKKL